ncbi:hypothetical protein [Salipiger sp. PrR003]|uniref:hypothetical protein n=1 Tax=Salipiger sp. PrR003 TaxID=2706776 RepID=UPI0013DCE619|nr:hypothetical protein [Salipiger sp. PrR003]NDV48690.1 hypothetical protein [Salipiger sp. PrR003]
MKITELSQHLHQLRHNRSGRAIGSAMNVSEVWNAVLESDETSIDRLDIHIEDLPRPVDGMFARVVIPGEAGAPDQEIGAVYVHNDLPLHWRDFIIIKEMMHCFTPMTRYCSTPHDAGQVLQALVQRGGRYTLNVAADDVGILAAAEVILPHKTVESLLAANLDCNEIAARHGLHPEIVEEICRYDIVQWRKNGDLNGDF